MYHRIAMGLPRSAKDDLAEKEACAVAQDLIHQKEKYRRDKHKNQGHHRCHTRFPTGGPNNLCHFRPHLLEKCEWIRFRRQRIILEVKCRKPCKNLFLNSNQVRPTHNTPTAPSQVLSIYCTKGLSARCDGDFLDRTDGLKA